MYYLYNYIITENKYICDNLKKIQNGITTTSCDHMGVNLQIISHTRAN